jgi:hypothetical protein
VVEGYLEETGKRFPGLGKPMQSTPDRVRLTTCNQYKNSGTALVTFAQMAIYSPHPATDCGLQDLKSGASCGLLEAALTFL